MNRTFARVPNHFYRISLCSDHDSMTMALVPDQEHANLIASLLTEHYGLRRGERIIVTPTVVRSVDAGESVQSDMGLK